MICRFTAHLLRRHISGRAEDQAGFSALEDGWAVSADDELQI